MQGYSRPLPRNPITSSSGRPPTAGGEQPSFSQTRLTPDTFPVSPSNTPQLTETGFEKPDSAFSR